MQPNEIIVVDSDHNQYPLSHFINAPRLVSAYLWITAPVARVMLDRNHEPEKGIKGTNRRSNNRSITRYISEMESGLWVPTTSGIGFNTSGSLTNGAHRLKALLKAAVNDPNIKIEQLVCGGLTDQSRLKDDIGRKRTLAQMLGMNGYVNTEVLQAALRLAHCYDNVPYRDEASWGREVPMTIEEHLKLVEETGMDGYAYWGNHMRQLMHKHAAMAVMYLAERDCPQGNPAEFMDSVFHGLNLGATDAAWQLREHLLRNKGQRTTGMIQMALWIKAFNRHLENMHLPEAQRTVFKPRFITNERYPRFMVHWQPPVPETDDV